MVEGGALQGLRVLDMTDASGRLAGKLLAEAGADVVRLRREASGPVVAGATAELVGCLSGHARRERAYHGHADAKRAALAKWPAEQWHDEAADLLSDIGRIQEQITKDCSSSRQPGFTR